MKNTNAPAHTRSNGSSFNGRMNSITSKGFLWGGMRDVMVRSAMIIMKRMRKAAVRIAQGKPTSLIKRWTWMRLALVVSRGRGVTYHDG